MVSLSLMTDRLQAVGRRRHRRPGEAGGVLLLCCGGLGDVVLFSLVLGRFLELAQGGEKVEVLLRREAAKMAFLFPAGVGVRRVDFGRYRKNLSYRWRTNGDLYRANFRLVVSVDYLRHPHLDEAMVEACAAPRTMAMAPRPWPKHQAALDRNRRLYGRLVDSGPVHRDKVVRWADFAARLIGNGAGNGAGNGTGNHAQPPLVQIPAKLLPAAAAVDGPLVILQPFSAVKGKQSPVGLYEKIIDALPDGYEVVITGAPDDLERNPEFASLVEKPAVRFDCSTFQAVAPLLRAARLVISVDTALMHLAIAMGAPTLGLASAAYVGEIVPYAAAITPPNAHFVYHSMACEGCLGACDQPPEKGVFPCVARLDEGEIIRKVKELVA